MADRFGLAVVLITVCYLSALFTLAIWIPAKSNAVAILFAALYGFSSGGVVSLGPAVIAQISRVDELGVRLGTYFAVISIAALVSNPIGGALVPNAQTDPFWKLQVFAGVMMAVGSTLYVAAFKVIARQ